MPNSPIMITTNKEQPTLDNLAIEIKILQIIRMKTIKIINKKLFKIALPKKLQQKHLILTIT